MSWMSSCSESEGVTTRMRRLLDISIMSVFVLDDLMVLRGFLKALCRGGRLMEMNSAREGG